MECSERQQPLDYRIPNKNGAYYWAIDDGKPRFNGDGRFLGFIGTVTDISERKLAEEKLQINEERLRLSVESTGLGTWDFYPDTDLLNWDNCCRELFGLGPDAVVDYTIFLKGLRPRLFSV